MTGRLAPVELLLRSRGRFSASSRRVPWNQLVLIILATGSIYGFAMGSFSGLTALWGQSVVEPERRILQAIYSALKVPALLAITSAICLPSFFVLNTLLGLRDDFSAAMRAILTAQGTLAITLASLAPLILLLYCSTERYTVASISNGLMFFVATLAAQVMMRRHYRHLIARNPRHRVTLLVWLILYVFVATQAAWMFRPFIGDPQLEVAFVRADDWGNCYVKIFEAVTRFTSGR